MVENIWLRSHLELCLQRLETGFVGPDDDGDYLIEDGTAEGYVGIDEDDSPTLIRVVITAANDVPWSAKLGVELNEINTNLRSARIFWADGNLVVIESILAESLTTETIHHALWFCMGVANELGPTLAAVFGGITPTYAPIEEDATD